MQAAGKNATAEQIQALRVELGLDRPLHMQYVFYLKQILSFDFGRSWATKQKISTMISDGVGASLSLTVPAFLLTLLITIVFGMLVAYLRDTTFDRATLMVCLALLSISPLVYILAGQYFLSFKLDMFPIAGWEPSWIERWQYLFLPIIIYVGLSLGGDILFYRTVFLDEMYQDYVRTAKAKGLATKQILFKHILRNALIPIITRINIYIPHLIVGSLLLESFFSIPGLGGLIFQAIQNADFPVIKAMTFISAVLYMVFQLLSDVLYAVVDPKVQLR